MGAYWWSLCDHGETDDADIHDIKDRLRREVSVRIGSGRPATGGRAIAVRLPWGGAVGKPIRSGSPPGGPSTGSGAAAGLATFAGCSRALMDGRLR